MTSVKHINSKMNQPPKYQGMVFFCLFAWYLEKPFRNHCIQKTKMSRSINDSFAGGSQRMVTKVNLIDEHNVLTEIPEFKYIRYMRSHSSNIHGENVHIWAVERKTHFSKTEIYFHTKTTPQKLAHTGLQNIKVGVKSTWATCQICSMEADILSRVRVALNWN